MSARTVEHLKNGGTIFLIFASFFACWFAF